MTDSASSCAAAPTVGKTLRNSSIITPRTSLRVIFMRRSAAFDHICQHQVHFVEAGRPAFAGDSVFHPWAHRTPWREIRKVDPEALRGGE